MKSDLEAALLFQIRASGLPEPCREVVFHDTRFWRFDFGWIEQRVAVEVEGGVWTEGRHQRPQGFIGDCEKYNEAALLGWTVLRVTKEHIDNGLALAWIEGALANREEINQCQLNIPISSLLL